VSELRFFDCWCRVGPRSIVHPRSFHDTATLVGAMKYYGIAKALAYHSFARENSPAQGNALLAEELRAYPAIAPVWTVMPHHTGEFAEPDRLAPMMAAAGVRAVTMFPIEHEYVLSPWNAGALLRAIESGGFPLLLSLEQVTWDGLHDILERYPGLNVVMCGLHYAINRNIYALLQEFPRLFLETSGVMAHRGIEDVCARFGARRLVFGSGMPVMAGGAAVSMVLYAAISEEEKAMIAHGNLERLLEGVQA